MNGIEPPTPMSTGSMPSQASVNAARAASYAGPVASIAIGSPVSTTVKPSSAPHGTCSRGAGAGSPPRWRWCRPARCAARSGPARPARGCCSRRRPWGVQTGDAERRLGPQPLDDRARADPLDARRTHRTRPGAAPRGSPRRRPGRRADPRRRRCPRRRAAWRSPAPASSGSRARGRPTCRSARRGSSVRTSTSTRTRPRRLVVSAGTPMSQLPLSAITITSAASVVARPARAAPRGCREPTSSSPSTNTVTPTARSSPSARTRGEVRGDAGLVVGGAAAVEAAAALGRLERRGVPVGVVVLRLDVVVGVEQHRRRALGPGLVRDHGRRAAVGAGDPGRRSPRPSNSAAHRLGAAPHLAGPRRVGADRLDPDEVLEVLPDPGQDLLDTLTKLGEGHGLTLGSDRVGPCSGRSARITRKRAPRDRCRQ